MSVALQKLGTVIPDITNVQRATIEVLLLQVQAPRSPVRNAQVGVDPENAARTCAAIRSRRRERRPSRARGDHAHARGRSVITAVLPDEHGDVRDFVAYTRASTDNSFPSPGNIPNNSKTRREVVVVTVIRRRHLLANLSQPNVGIEIAEQIVGE